MRSISARTTPKSPGCLFTTTSQHSAVFRPVYTSPKIILRPSSLGPMFLAMISCDYLHMDLIIVTRSVPESMPYRRCPDGPRL